MNWSLKIFSIKGIEVKIHLTFSLILIWAGYRWGVDLEAGPIGMVYGVIVTLLLFFCVTLHELAHSFTAMRYGAKVKDITLLPIGGVAQMERIPEKPEQELRIALAGPLSNLIIAGFLIAVFKFSGNNITVGFGNMIILLGSLSWKGLMAYLITANFILALFNLFPAFPMDGGRVLRAVLAAGMDYAGATVWAAKIGQGLAWLLGFFGFTSRNWSLVLIAIFIHISAGQEGRVAEVKRILGNIRVRQVMTREITVLSTWTMLSEAMEAILHCDQRDFPVVEGEKVVGFLTETDLINAMQKFPANIIIQEIMRNNFPTINPEESLFDAKERILKARVGAIPVVEADKLVGMLTIHDINEAYRFLANKYRLFKRKK